MYKATVVFLFAAMLCGCETTPRDAYELKSPEGYERTTTGSGCREIATGQYVSLEKCTGD